MDVTQSYNLWADQYDSDENRTRDLEGIALREVLADVGFAHCLEAGCGTGKNTAWLASRAQGVTAVDISENMLAKAKAKDPPANIVFKQGNITEPWTFAERKYELITFSLVLEHVEHLEPVFKEAVRCLTSGGHVYVGELHPFRQYSGSKARFNTGSGVHVIRCFNHHVSDFIRSAKAAGLSLVDLDEYFDDHDRTAVPRILTLLFKRSN